MTDLIDAAGIPLSEHRRWLPPRVSDFPRVKTIKDPQSLQQWRAAWVMSPCWWCGHSTNSHPVSMYHGEVHHIARHDCNFALSWLCAKCHRLDGEAVKASSLSRLLEKKWQYDRDNTLWVQLAIGLGRFLPED